ncbi:MAG: dienelactone hydrolase family protein [Dermatophilus congolensis]|nr:dienelactone hydrolase family protein [Dermatophilus congolensis]
MADIAGWTRTSHTADSKTHDIYRKGVGPGVVLIHEAPGLTTAVIEFAEKVVAAGYTVVMPHLFGKVGRSGSLAETLDLVPRMCVSREFTVIALRRSPPMAVWLRSLARELHDEVGGPGVGAIGMCFTGGFALAMMVDAPVEAPVVAQPAMPAPLGARRKADIGLSDRDLEAVKRRAAAGCPVLGLKYADDPSVGTRFDTLRRELGDAFIAVELPGKGHSTLTDGRSDMAVDRVLSFFAERLKGQAPGATQG